MHSYPSIYAIGHRYIADIFKDSVLIEEKIDGSQFSFGLLNGELVCRSKGAQVHVEAPEGMFKKAVESVLALKEKLHPEWTYRCEYLAKPKHNALAYDRVPKHNLILFDINTGEESYLSYLEKQEEAVRLGLEIVPFLDAGFVSTPEQLLKMLDRVSILGGSKIEGIVIKNYSRFGQDKKVLMGKFVSEMFKEVHSKEWKATNPVLNDVVDRIVATLKTEARWHKAAQHLRERGELEESPRDIGKLIAEAREDILKEEQEFIREKLYEWAAPRIARACVAGLPEWYKEQLLKSAFVDTASSGG